MTKFVPITILPCNQYNCQTQISILNIFNYLHINLLAENKNRIYKKKFSTSSGSCQRTEADHVKFPSKIPPGIALRDAKTGVIFMHEALPCCRDMAVCSRIPRLRTRCELPRRIWRTRRRKPRRIRISWIRILRTSVPRTCIPPGRSPKWT
jgi:hypothetical protein